MKQLLIIAAFLCILGSSASAQTLPPAPADKAVVYFVRHSSLGFAINFSYFDSTQIIGRFNGPKYLRYECTPGHHLFWARSENRDFIDANLEAGKIYLIEAEPRMGAMKAAVRLNVVTPADEKKIKMIRRLLEKKEPVSFSAEELASLQSDMQNVIERGMQEYLEEKVNGNKITILEASNTFPGIN